LSDPRFAQWIASLEERHLAELTFPEVSRALRALSSAYVERRARLSRGEALSGAGKRAAFALFYGPLHFLVVRHVASALRLASDRVTAIIDLGCGTGASGAGFAAGAGGASSIVGVDRSAWALDEAARTYRAFGLKSRTIRGDFAAGDWGSPAKGARDRAAIVAAFAINELDEPSRDALRQRLLDRASRGDAVLVIEPLAGFVAPWWGEWRRTFEEAGGRADEWRARIELPAIVQKLDRAAGLDHRELTARSLAINNEELGVNHQESRK
jgi:hypothetical protein